MRSHDHFAWFYLDVGCRPVQVFGILGGAATNLRIRMQCLVVVPAATQSYTSENYVELSDRTRSVTGCAYCGTLVVGERTRAWARSASRMVARHGLAGPGLGWGGSARQPPGHHQEGSLALPHLQIIYIGNMLRQMLLLAFILPTFIYHTND